MRGSGSLPWIMIVVVSCALAGCNLNKNRTDPMGPGTDGGESSSGTGSDPGSTGGTGTAIGQPSGYGTEAFDEIDAQSVSSLKIRTGRGSVTIIGDPTATTISVRATLDSKAENVREAERIVREIPVRFVSRGTENPSLILNEPNLSGLQDYNCNLVINLPSHVRVSIDNSGGDVSIPSVESGVDVTHSGGLLSIKSVRGGVEMNSTGSAAELQDLSGLVSIVDGQGSLIVQLVTGEVQITDTAGPLQVRFITGNVTARNNPGQPEFQNIDGDLTLVGIVHNNAKVEGVVGKVSYPTSD